MAPRFLSLPPEIRNQIYRLLLVTGKDYITFTHDRSKPGTPPKQDTPAENAVPILNDDFEQPLIRITKVGLQPTLFPAILATCLQIYWETIGILYRENTFRYKQWKPRYNDATRYRCPKIDSNAFYNGIKLEIEFFEDNEPERYNDEFLHILWRFSETRCSPYSIELYLACFSTTPVLPRNDVALFTYLLQDDRLLFAIRTLGVRCHLNITLNDDTLEHADAVKTLFQSSQEQGWQCAGGEPTYTLTPASASPPQGVGHTWEWALYRG